MTDTIKQNKRMMYMLLFMLHNTYEIAVQKVSKI